MILFLHFCLQPLQRRAPFDDVWTRTSTTDLIHESSDPKGSKPESISDHACFSNIPLLLHVALFLAALKANTLSPTEAIDQLQKRNQDMNCFPTALVRCAGEQASVTTDADVLTAVNIQYFRDGQAVSLDAMFGNSATYDSSGALTGARAMLQVICF